MKTVKAIIVGMVCLTAGAANAQWVVSDPGNLAQGIINTTKQIVETSATAQHTLDGFKETAKIFEQGRKYYDALKAVHDVVKGGVKVKKSIDLVADISEIYVRNYQKMLGDPNYTPDELSTISFGYAKLLSESAGHPARPEERGECDGNVALGRRTAGNHRPELQAAAGIPQPRTVLHEQKHIGKLPAGEEEKGHRPGDGSLRGCGRPLLVRLAIYDNTCVHI